MNIAPIPKKGEAQPITDYRLISVMHNTAKLMSLILAHRLAPHLDRIVSKSQRMFIKGRSIHDNSQYVL
jgi:hypothetical protein